MTLIPDSDLMNMFRWIASKGGEIRLLNNYKGLPIANEAKIVAVGTDAIQVSSSRYQLACLYLNRETYIQSNDLPGSLWSHVTGLSTESLQAVLTDFHFAQPTFDLRNQIRVETSSPVEVILQLHNPFTIVQTSLADISANGIGVYLDRQRYHPRLFETGTELRISLSLPEVTARAPQTASLSQPDRNPRPNRDPSYRPLTGSLSTGALNRQPAAGADKRFTARGRIMNVIAEPLNNSYRIGIKFIHDDNTRVLLNQFINARQTEIIQEIKMLYELLDKFKQ